MGRSILHFGGSGQEDVAQPIPSLPEDSACDTLYTVIICSYDYIAYTYPRIFRKYAVFIKINIYSFSNIKCKLYTKIYP